jgi:hypothetical protein
MGQLDFRKSSIGPIQFSEENVNELMKLSDQLGDILIKSGYGFRVDYISQIRLAAEGSDIAAFKNLVMSDELFGGSGALWEIWIEDEECRNGFTKVFREYVDHLKKMGINNDRVNQVIQFLDNLS